MVKSKKIKRIPKKQNIFKRIQSNFTNLTSTQKTLIIISLIIVILLFTLITLNLGVKVRFLVLDELQINLKPLQTIINTNHDSFQIDFDISVNSFRFCKTQCIYQIKDTYTEEIVLSNNLTLSGDKNFKQTFTLEKTIPKFGQQIYYFEIECNNIKTFICKTNNVQKYRSSLITVNYDYNNQTQTLLSKNKYLLSQTQTQILNSLQNQIHITHLISRINQTIPTNMSFILKQIGPEFNKALQQYKYQNFTKSLELLNTLNISSDQKDLFDLKTKITQYNQNIELINFAHTSTFNQIFDFYNKTNQNKSSEMETIYNSFNTSTFENVLEIQNTTEIKQTLTLLNTTYYQDKSLFESTFFNTLDNYYTLLSKTKSLEKNNLTLCTYANNLSQEITIHNQQTLTTNDPLILKTTEFIKENLFTIEENQTHLISHNDTFIKLNSLTLKENLNYILIPQIDLTYCNITYNLFTPKKLNKINTSLNEEPLLTTQEIEQPNKFSCIFQNCSVMPEKNPSPILFLHGHSFNKDDPPESSISAFYKIRQKLAQEKIIINGGDIDYTSANNGFWANSNIPLGLSATYFYITYYDINLFAQSIRKEEGIEVYSIRLKELIDTTLSQTNSNQVIIVAHSMGGLVARNYLNLFGEDKVQKLILIAAPNNGVEGTINNLCSYFGEQKACNDLSKDSLFLKKLSTYKPKLPIYNIIGQGCENGDGVVTINSAKLPYKENYQEYYVNGTCNDLMGVSFHTDILDPNKYPKTYNLVKELIE